MKTKVKTKRVEKPEQKVAIERAQLGVRMEVRLIKVLKAFAEYSDISLGELLEDIILHSFEGPDASAFAKGDFKVIEDLKRVYGMNYSAHTNYRFVEKNLALVESRDS